jgi:serine/threonine protein kinase
MIQFRAHMLSCPSCHKDIDAELLSCPSCGTVIDEFFDATRRLSDSQKYSPKPPGQRTSQSGLRSPSSFDSIDDARFVPGTILAARYRIVGLLGRGGMGEVYRADDMKLAQPVALKFLPEALAGDGATLARFHREVRVSRQVSHRNVCRVYDIGEINGQHFLSMEFISGEELASLMRRIGRLPPDKANEIARQLCAGLAAAHDTGILHRDLKPANIMIDNHGNVRITDFGIAGLAEEIRTEEVTAGTPSYMSPEQIEGGELTIKSDLYSLGLVLYELFTGKKAFEARSLVELMHLRRSDATPTLPTVLVKDLDPTIERVILRCIQKDPAKRPGSALQVAAALPGGDPLAAALAAGETPSPEMVAAATKQGALRPPVAALMLAAIVIGLAATVWLSGKVLLHRQIPLEKSPTALVERAITLTNKFGYVDPPTDSDYGFDLNRSYLRYILQNDKSPNRWQRLSSSPPPAISFWYNQSPRYFEPFLDSVSIDNPPIPSYMVSVLLDTRGQLRKFVAAPPQVDQGPGSSAEMNWMPLLTEAGFDQATLKPVTSTWVPPVNSDARAAWEGQHAGQPPVPVRIEAAAYHGKPVYFEIIEPWTTPYRAQQETQLVRLRILLIAAAVLALIVLTGACLLARRNLRLGRGDRKGAFKLALFIFILQMVAWLFGAHHVFSLGGEFKSFFINLALSLTAGMIMWLIYIALEPFLRRRWPHRIISWNRLLSGDLRDPLIGRDILIGALCGTLVLLNTCIWHALSSRLGPAPAMPVPVSLITLLGAPRLVTFFSAHLISSLVNPAVYMLMLLLFSIVLRKERLAIALFWLMIVAFQGLASSNLTTGLIDAALGSAIFLFILVRFGLLASIFAEFFILLGVLYPLTSDFSAWYSGVTIFALAIGLGLAIYGFYVSLAGQPLFRGGLLQD